jgi:TRAP-type C4-dicarboxylate transport system permease small subunit
MSQEKVDRYKRYKKNRDKIIRRERMMVRLEIGIAILIAVAFVGWFGWSIYSKVTNKGTSASTVTATEVDMNDYINYVSGLQSSFSQ